MSNDLWEEMKATGIEVGAKNASAIVGVLDKLRDKYDADLERLDRQTRQQAAEIAQLRSQVGMLLAKVMSG